MKLGQTAFWVAAGLFFVGADLFAAGPPATGTGITTPPVYVPDLSHANDPLPDGILAWDETSKATDVAAEQPQAHFVFNFTNIAEIVDRTWATNVTTLANITAVTNRSFWGKRISFVTNLTTITNIAWITNSIKSVPVTILDVHPGCQCTTTELPTLPWTIAPGSNGQIRLTVNLAGRSGTLIKSANVSTDKGFKNLIMRINILPPVIPKPTDEERARDIAAAKIDRQAVFHDDCAKCHANNIQGKYGKPLYDSVCGICHEVEQRAAMVPDLHNLKTPTSDEFWRTWIAHGKPGSLMPAFATSDGGPLTDIQIASLAAYLNVVVKPQVPINK